MLEGAEYEYLVLGFQLLSTMNFSNGILTM